VGELHAALVAALGDLTVIGTGRTANAGTYSYAYASIEDVVKVTRPVLQRHGLVALTPVHDHGPDLACTVKLIHTSGETLDLGPFPFPHGKDAQATGSAVTYHRRYALIAALGMATGEDDDGAAAVPRAPQEDPAIPGLRSSLEGAIGKLSDEHKAALKAWFAENNLPPVRRMNAAQCDRVLDYLMDLPAEGS
jgi:hypothetical protein